MSAWSNRKKLLININIFILFVVFLSVVLFLIFYKPPTCTDNIQNGDEFGVDCGGGCPNKCVAKDYKLSELWSKAIKLADGVYSGITLIENQNINLYIPRIQFEMLFFDKGGSVITRASDYTSILPSGNTPIFVPHVLTKERDVSSVSFRFIDDLVFKEIDKNIEIKVLSIDTNDIYGKKPTATAKVINKTENRLRDVYFVIILYDELNTTIASSRTFIKNLEVDKERDLVFTWPRPLIFEKSLSGGKRKFARAEIIPIPSY